MDEKILRETFDHNLNESFRLKQLENGLSVFTVIKTTQTNLVTKSMEKPLFAHIRVTSRCNLKCAYCYAEDETTSTDMTDESILSVVKMCHIHGILCITWTGGEPLIRDNFYDVISLAYNYGIKQTILTNGTLLERVHREKWPKDNINFQVSLNEVWIKFEEAKESISPMPSTALSVRFVQTIIRKKNPKRRKKIVTRFFCRSLAATSCGTHSALDSARTKPT